MSPRGFNAAKVHESLNYLAKTLACVSSVYMNHEIVNYMIIVIRKHNISFAISIADDPIAKRPFWFLLHYL
ncbi:hypothetical protein L6452_29975 [Arctium lappa]|uniref:Uncharacterized protein n=1 Tax=Arctium lappa TaxID=4217 RepID=A0ACB8ZHZ1_ARCLA|nr:hypothetical protein L6452_29975 [Arctium lappa]